MSPVCLHCQHSFDVAAFLGGLLGYAHQTNSGVAPCPLCGKHLEFQVRGQQLILGFCYFGGALHFEGLTRYRVSTLKKIRDGDQVALAFRGQTYRPPASDAISSV